MSPRYDYVFAGAGAAGLSLAVRLARSARLAGKSILLIDRDLKRSNDRTWCFWERDPGEFEQLVYRRWPKAWFHGAAGSRLLDLSPYTYKLIRGIDFYKNTLGELLQHPQVSFQQGEITGIKDEEGGASCNVNGEPVRAGIIFTSLYRPPGIKPPAHWLLQHFRGWRIQMREPVFDPGVAVLMDFRVSQSEGTTFVYVLPFSDTEALVEYTLFSPTELSAEEYEKGLSSYLEKFYPGRDYDILEREAGVIPMTDHRFPDPTDHVIPIGTAGGVTKPSSGYTFSFIQKHSSAIRQALETGEPVKAFSRKKRFGFYDRTLLEVLQNNLAPGSLVFEKLFLQNPPARILRFLDEETNYTEEMLILASLPWKPFLRAAFK